MLKTKKSGAKSGAAGRMGFGVLIAGLAFFVFVSGCSGAGVYDRGVPVEGDTGLGDRVDDSQDGAIGGDAGSGDASTTGEDSGNTVDSGEESGVDELEIRVTDKGVKYIVDPSKILSGGPGRGGIGVDRGIPAIAKPAYVSLEEADNWIQDNELVLAIQYKGVKRVYPLQVLVWHEIVNDTIAGDPILITYCPLCGSGIAFERKVDGQVTRFGTSGKLYNSNLVMYDELTDTYWTQIDGLAIVGERTGERLKPVSIDTVVWRDWKKFHPDSEVLSKDTGFVRAYGRDPYGTYYEDSFLLFPVDEQDNRIHPKDVVFGIEVNGMHKAYREQDLKKNPIIEDTVNSVPVRVSRDEAGIVKIINMESGEEIVKEREFWFAWYAFHPKTGLYGQ